MPYNLIVSCTEACRGWPALPAIAGAMCFAGSIFSLRFPFFLLPLCTNLIRLFVSWIHGIMVLFVVPLVIFSVHEKHLGVLWNTLISATQCMYITIYDIHKEFSKHKMPHEYGVFHIVSQAL